MKALAAVALTLLAGTAAAGPPRHSDYAPRFLPGGTRIVFSHGGEYEDSTVTLGGVRATFKDDMTWSPSGRYVARYVKGAQVVSGAGGGTHALGDAWSVPAWSRDETRLVYATSTDLVVARGDGANPQRVPVAVPAVAGTSVDLDRPSLSPDGRRIAFLASYVPLDPAQEPGDVRAALFVVDAAGGEARAVGPAEICPSESDVRWSPSGAWLAYVADGCKAPSLAFVRADGAKILGRRVRGVARWAWSPAGDVVAYAAGGAVTIATPTAPLRTLPRASSPTWSPAGDRLAVAQRGWIAVLRAPAGAPRRLAPGSSPSWSPRGDLIAYVVPTCGPRQGIHVIRPDGRGDRRVTWRCVIAAAGRDVRGTPFADEIDARDGVARRVACGAGRDLVRADRRDRVARDCERVSR